MALYNASQWPRPASLRDDNSHRSRINSVDPGLDATDRDEPVDPRMAAFRDSFIRSARHIDRLFPTDRPCCRLDEDELELLEKDDFGFGRARQLSPVEQKPVAKAPVTRRIEEDDYDEEDEDEEPKPPAKPPPASSASLLSPPLLSTPSGSAQQNSLQVPGKDNADPIKTREKLEADRKAAEEAAKVALSTMFFTLENDRDAMLEQEKLEESDRQVHAETTGPEQTGVRGSLSSVNLGASNLTLRNLFARIDQKRDLVKASDTELRNLISEVRKNRSKWASEDRIGQEELYEAAEKVVNELRAYTEHSTAFLNRVNKREAPDYFNIIKHPMDLGTVLKKLKALAYKSKAEFVADLNLIWDNCFTYNADPSHYLRKHAKAMQKKMQEMIPLIPDITIRDRAEVEAEEAAAAEVDAEAESDDEPIMATRGRKGPGTKKAKKARGHQARELRSEATPEIKAPLVNVVRADSLPPANDGTLTGATQNGFLTPPVGATPLNGTAGSQMDVDMPDRPDDDDDVDPEYLAWKTMTKKARAHISSKRHKMFHGDRLNADEPALLRSREGMGSYIRKELKHYYRHEDDTPKDSILHTNGKRKLVDEGEEELLLPDYYDPLSCVPELPWRVEWRGDGEPDILEETARIGPKEAFCAPRDGLVKKMAANIASMQETRKICSKITVIKQMQSQVQLYANQFTKYDPKGFVEQEPEDFVVAEDGPIYAKEVARAAIQRSIGKIFYHAGFEEFQPTAMDAITDIATDYMQKLAKTVMLYREAPQKFSHQEVVLHALHENGVDLEAMDSYIRDDVERLNSKLNAVQGRMRAHLADLLRPAINDTSADGSGRFQDGSEEFIGGDFAEEIGDDFFGFRELGLDKEFGLSSLSVPLHLLQKTFRSTADSNLHAAASHDGFKPPPPFEPLTHELLKKQIGLVQNFFLAKLHASNGEALVEDEDLPVKQRAPKPRLPPTGKILTPRKRPQQSQGGGSKKKKKPNPPPMAAQLPKLALPGGKNDDKDEEEPGNVGMISPESIGAT